MKILKHAEQKNFIVNKDMYTERTIQALMDMGFVFWFDDNFTEHYTTSKWLWDEKEYRVYASNIEEIKVIYNKEYGFYETIAKMFNKEIIHINL